MTGETLALVLQRTVAKHPQRVALVDDEGALTYQQLDAAVRRWASALMAAGLEPGQRLALLLPKDRNSVFAIFAAATLGAVFVPVNMQFKAEQIRSILEDSEAALILSDTNHWRRLDLQLHLPKVLMVEELPQRSTCESNYSPQADDLAALLYTSGSTGNAKGVMLSQANLVAGARIVSHYLGLSERDRLLAALPFSFDYGLNQLFSAVWCGAAVRLLEFTFGNQIVQCLKRDGCTVLAGVPTMWGILVTMTPCFTKPLPQLRLLTNSGGALPLQTIAALQEIQPQADLVLMYGLTEAFRSTFVPVTELATHRQSIGWAMPETEIFLVDSDHQLCAVGEPGMLVHAGPTVAMGYWRNTSATAQVFRPDPRHSVKHPSSNSGSSVDHSSPKVVYSGDYAVQIADGSFRFLGRKDALIKSCGYRISPTEVEGALLSHPTVQSAAVIGIPDELLGQRVHAICVATDSTQMEAHVVLRAVAKRLAAHQVPRALEWVKELPLTSHGKIDYQQLQAERVDVA